MNILIMTDMEGISGICRKSQVMNSEPDYQQGRKLMTMDINACVKGCLAGGAKRVIVRDAHCTGFNVIWEELEPGAEYVQGTSEERLPYIDSTDGVILLGYHAMAGTEGGVLEHTMSSMGWQNFWMNGQKVGEIAIDAGIAGDHDVPVIMVSGDDFTCAEASKLLKGVVTVQVKRGLGAQGACLLTKEKAHDLIFKGAAEAVKNCRKAKPYKVKKPVVMRLELVSRGVLPSVHRGVKRIDGRTYEVTADSVEKALCMI